MSRKYKEFRHYLFSNKIYPISQFPSLCKYIYTNSITKLSHLCSIPAFWNFHWQHFIHISFSFHFQLELWILTTITSSLLLPEAWIYCLVVYVIPVNLWTISVLYLVNDASPFSTSYFPIFFQQSEFSSGLFSFFNIYSQLL